MKKNRLIFYAIFATFHLIAFIFTVLLDNNTNLLFSMVKYVPWFKYGTLLGVLLLIADFVWAWLTNKEANKEKAKLTHELDMLKSRLFDLQEAAKK
jgi:hypothetical protein